MTENYGLLASYCRDSILRVCSCLRYLIVCNQRAVVPYCREGRGLVQCQHTCTTRLVNRPTAHTLRRGHPAGAPSPPGPGPTLRKFSAPARRPPPHHTQTVLYRHPSSATFSAGRRAAQVPTGSTFWSSGPFSLRAARHSRCEENGASGEKQPSDRRWPSMRHPRPILTHDICRGNIRDRHITFRTTFRTSYI